MIGLYISTPSFELSMRQLATESAIDIAQADMDIRKADQLRHHGSEPESPTPSSSSGFR